MKKLAVFVEGNTELLFVERLLSELANDRSIRLDLARIRGGSKIPRSMTIVRAAQPDSGQRYYALIVDCGGDHQVKTRILEEHENLTRSGYCQIIGLRDVRPTFSYAEVAKLEQGLRTYIKTSLIPVEFVLAVMEIEAWFLAEYLHFPLIDPAITPEAIRAGLGFDVCKGDLSQRSDPADDLNNSYKLAGKEYKKSNSAATVSALDCGHLYLELSSRIAYLRRLTTAIEGFLA